MLSVGRDLIFQPLFIISLILFVFQMNNDLDLDLKYFEVIYAIDITNKVDDKGAFIVDSNEYFEEDNVPQNSKNIQIKQSEEGSTSISNSSSKSNLVNNSIIYDNDINIVAVGDWDCTGETEDTVDNIIKQDPELVLALGDLSYNGKAKCWLKLIEPIANKTKIVIGNHEVDSSKLLKDYMDYFELEEQYYSFNYGNVHFIVLSTEMDFDDDSEQYQFAVDDLEKYSNDTSIEWIIASFHKQVYSSGSSPEDEEDFREIYHPLFDKYNVDLALEGHLHAYERMYPITFNSNDEDEPIVMDTNPSTYNNPNGTIFITVGTGGAHDMELSSLDSFSAVGIDGDFGILDINLKNSSNTNNNESSIDTNNNKILTGKFIENEDDGEFKILDEFKIIKTS